MKKILLVGFFLLAGIILYNNLNPKTYPKKINNTAMSKVTINSATFKVLLARTPSEQQKGLGYRESLPTDVGMLFLFPDSSLHSFWMHGMKFPLDIIFILKNKVVAVYEDLPPLPDKAQNPLLYGSDVLSDTVLEINSGLSKKYNIKPGDKIIINLN